MNAREYAHFPLMAHRYPADIRADIRVFAEIVHLADHVAGNELRPATERRGQLLALERAIAGLPAPLWSDDVAALVSRHREDLRRRGLAAERTLRIITACRADIDAPPRRTWAEVIDCCGQIAAPVGRHLMILFQEDVRACGAASDALYCGTHILRKLCDRAVSAEPFQRLCIPLDYLRDACITEAHLAIPTARGQTRAVLDRVLDGVDRLLEAAEPLVGGLRARPLRINAAITLHRAHQLAAACRRGDPLQELVTLSPWQGWRCGWNGWWRAMLS